MRAPWLTRRAVLQGLGVAALASAAASLGVLLARRSTGRHSERNDSASPPSASPSWTSRVRELHERIEQQDFVGAAKEAGYLTDEAFTGADRVVQAWLAARDKYLGFLPRTIHNDKNRIWNYKDCAADIYCHFVIEASLIAPGHLGALRDILAKERAIGEGVPRSIRLDSGEILSETLDERIFGAVEYAKDGLLPILERMGPNEWLDRLHEVVQAVLHASPVATRHGLLPSETTETNGQFLQVLARLYRRERRPEYLAAGRAIADAYVEEILPFGQGVPAGAWNFDAQMPRVRTLRLRDHGNEIVSGLAEWVMAETEAPDSRAAQYRPDLERMMDQLLDHARDAAGLWSDRVLPAGEATPAPPARPVNDNWGYLTAGYAGYALSLSEDAPCRKRYLDASRRAFAAAIQYRGAAWQDGAMDGYADSIEGAQYLLPFLKIDAAARWIDDETGILLAYQRPDGFVGRTYLDGNFVRTALLYALFRTQGARLDPWRPGVRLGAVMSSEGLHVAIDSDAPWRGRVVFDSIRHRDYLNLPFDYPRLNGWPEWFTVNPDARYKITRSMDRQMSGTNVVDGKDLANGLSVDGHEGGLVLHVSAV